MRAGALWEVVVTEDDADDYQLLQVAWARAGVVQPLMRMEDGIALLHHLRRPGARTALILLDVKMPRRSGHEVLATLKTDPALRAIPVVMLSTSDREPDIRGAYELGAAAYFVKPDALDGMTSVVSCADIGLRRPNCRSRRSRRLSGPPATEIGAPMDSNQGPTEYESVFGAARGEESVQVRHAVSHAGQQHVESRQLPPLRHKSLTSRRAFVLDGMVSCALKGQELL